MRSFASDNNSGVHPDIIKAMATANKDHCVAYGADPYTKEAEEKIKETFGSQTEVYFVYNGTGANVTSLATYCRTWNSIICSDIAHIYVDECGAPEHCTGAKLQPVKSKNGKLTTDGFEQYTIELGIEHHAQPKVASITQATEHGTVYTLEEVKTIAEKAHELGMVLHMDGARLANAAVALGVDLKTATTDCGVDVLSFGGTKNGIMFGEAVIFLNPDCAEHFKFLRKNYTQLPSKMRFISAQYTALLTHDLWQKNAAHANSMAKLLAKKLAEVPGVHITSPVEVNSVFATLPEKVVTPLQQHYFFYIWDFKTTEARLMTSFDTTREDVENFIKILKILL